MERSSGVSPPTSGTFLSLCASKPHFVSCWPRAILIAFSPTNLARRTPQTGFCRPNFLPRSDVHTRGGKGCTESSSSSRSWCVRKGDETPKRQTVSQVTAPTHPAIRFLPFRRQQDAHRGDWVCHSTTWRFSQRRGNFFRSEWKSTRQSHANAGNSKCRHSVVPGEMQGFSKLDSLFARELYFRDNGLLAQSDF